MTTMSHRTILILRNVKWTQDELKKKQQPTEQDTHYNGIDSRLEMVKKMVSQSENLKSLN